MYLDLSGNRIKDIENVTLPALKVLLLNKNAISKIRNINELVKLEVLDLANNKIAKIEGFGLLNSLRIVNFSSNNISRLENL